MFLCLTLQSYTFSLKLQIFWLFFLWNDTKKCLSLPIYNIQTCFHLIIYSWRVINSIEIEQIRNISYYLAKHNSSHFFCCFVAESVKKVRNLSFYLEFIRKVRIFAVILQLEVAFLQSRFVWVLIYIGWNVLFQPIFFLTAKQCRHCRMILFPRVSRKSECRQAGLVLCREV